MQDSVFAKAMFNILSRINNDGVQSDRTCCGGVDGRVVKEEHFGRLDPNLRAHLKEGLCFWLSAAQLKRREHASECGGKLGKPYGPCCEMRSRRVGEGIAWDSHTGAFGEPARWFNLAHEYGVPPCFDRSDAGI
jgi:hypothetical protein